VIVEWAPNAVTTASRFLDDPAGLAAVMEAVEALTTDPRPPGAVPWGEVFRLHVGRYRVMYSIEDDVVTIDRVDRVAG
jgi:mRNA interferase RelE/StbE